EQVEASRDGVRVLEEVVWDSDRTKPKVTKRS
ncbi:hypothetical protein A2U01_0094577, partial [Trifolium medium]|nr:hypothetical protein [Trifolium medium]